MSFSASVLFPWYVMERQNVTPRGVVAAVACCLSVLAYASESCVLCVQPHEQRGYMGSTPGLLKILQLWGGCQMIPLIVDMARGQHVHAWQLWASCASYSVCVLLSFVTLVVILGDLAGRCLLPFDRFLAGFSLIGVLLYMLATVICFTKILQLRNLGQSPPQRFGQLFIMETVVSSVTLLAYTVDLAFSIKQLCDRSHM